jgi:hypothetical protein
VKAVGATGPPAGDARDPSDVRTPHLRCCRPSIALSSLHATRTEKVRRATRPRSHQTSVHKEVRHRIRSSWQRSSLSGLPSRRPGIVCYDGEKKQEPARCYEPALRGRYGGTRAVQRRGKDRVSHRARTRQGRARNGPRAAAFHSDKCRLARQRTTASDAGRHLNGAADLCGGKTQAKKPVSKAPLGRPLSICKPPAAGTDARGRPQRCPSPPSRASRACPRRGQPRRRT